MSHPKGENVLKTQRPNRLKRIFNKTVRSLLHRVAIAVFCVTGSKVAIPEDLPTETTEINSDSIITLVDTIFKVENSEDANEDDCKITGQHRVDCSCHYLILQFDLV